MDHKVVNREEPRVQAYIEKHKDKCPDGYEVAIPGQSFNTDKGKDLWIIYTEHPEPVLVPPFHKKDSSWGYPLYYKTV